MKFKYWLLIIFLIVGFIFRAADINNNPKALYGDELTLLYDSYSILHTSMDQTGTFLPLSFPLGADRPPGNVYLNIPFVALFGLNPLGVRGLSVLSGLFLIFMMYALGELLFSRKVGVASALVAAFSPWGISMSRGGFETNLALVLALSGTYAFFRAESSKRWYLLSALGFGLAILTYPTYRLTIPLFVLFLLFIGGLSFLKRNIQSKSFILFLVVILFSAGLTLFLVTHRKSEDRFSQINILTQGDTRKTITDNINYERSIDQIPQPYLSFFHNKAIDYSELVLENYVGNFMPDFLFIHGDGEPRHNPASIGEMFWVEALFIILGFAAILKKNKKLLYTLIGWILITPIAATLVGGPHALRDSFMLPALLLLSASGLVVIWDQRDKFNIRALMVSLLALFLIQEIFFIQRVYFLSPARYAEFWNYSAKQASQVALREKSSYDRVILISSITNVESAYQVYAKLNSKDVIDNNRNKVDLYGYKFKRFDNVYLGEIPAALIQTFAKKLPGTTLIIAPASYQKNMENYSIERGPDSFVTLVLERVQNK